MRTRLTFLSVIILSLCAVHHVRAQTGPLTEQQIAALIAAKSPDAVVAGEITRRRVAFTVDQAVLTKCQESGAGPKTLAALKALQPAKPAKPAQPTHAAPAEPKATLDDAKTEIPKILTPLYQALNEGSASAAAAFMTAQLAASATKLDKICKPFSYKAHYIEGIIERPGQSVEVRTRVLQEPMDEDAYVLTFIRQGGHFVLSDVRDPDAAWMTPLLTATSDLARKFFYAARLQKMDILSQLVSPGVAITALYDPYVQQGLAQAERMEPRDPVLVKAKGLKGKIELRPNAACLDTMQFLVDHIANDYRIVQWSLHKNYGCGRDSKDWGSADPQIEAYTLQRFGLMSATPSPSGAPIAAAGDYDTLIKQGSDALRSGNIDAAYAALQTAANAVPARPEAWALLGDANLPYGKFSDAVAAWDKALTAGGTITLAVVHEKNFDSESGIFTLSNQAVSFLIAGKKVFGVPPTQVSEMDAGDGKGRTFMTGEASRRLGTWAYFRLKAAGKNYNFDFLPLGIQCQPRDWYIHCPPEGVEQQRVVAKYVIETIARLAKANAK